MPYPDKIVLFDMEASHSDLLPLSFTRPIGHFRVGILTMQEKWAKTLSKEVYCYPVAYLRAKYCKDLPIGDDDILFIRSTLLPDEPLTEMLWRLAKGELLKCKGETVAYRGDWEGFRRSKEGAGTEVDAKTLEEVRYVFDIFMRNGAEINRDFRLLTKGRRSCPVPRSNNVIGEFRLPDGTPSIFLEEGAEVEGVTLNVKYGPIYIGRDAELMEGSFLRGPVAICDHAHVNMGAKIYPDTTIGPWCKVGGEINNVVVFGYSNKAHDGFLGNAVIGEWCNIGAGVNASNLKNDYSKIRVWNYRSRTFMRTDLQFCGLIMGDHSKLGINCMMNTATVIGVGVNIHGSGFPRPFVPSFSEGSPTGGFTDVSLKKFFQIAERVMERRGQMVTVDDVEVYEKIYKVAAEFKNG